MSWGTRIEDDNAGSGNGPHRARKDDVRDGFTIDLVGGGRQRDELGWREVCPCEFVEQAQQVGDRQHALLLGPGQAAENDEALVKGPAEVTPRH